ncbi:MAG: sulfatase-like hydrolase/transferase [Caldilineaceae bacterium]|nr:sulfatase-like hydrolase/transferase [Caldilineaceae bacterium]
MNTTQRPNLLYIHTDQHNPYVTGCYGDPLVQTPNLDRLAANGVVFENTYCNSPICVPSRMSMLTGRHPYQNEVWTNSHVLDSGIPTLAHAMGAAGYRPVLIGRMHAVGPDQLHGYAERLVGDHSANHVGGRGPDRGALDGTAGPDRISLTKSGAGQSAYQVHDEYVTAATIDYLNRLGVQQKADGKLAPFSLTVGLMLPHPPYVARAEDYALYADQMTMPHKPAPFDQVSHTFLRAWREHTGIVTVSDDEIRRSRAAYWGLVHRVDLMVGQILQALEANGFADNTLIVYTSDHGDMQGEHGLWWKHVFYEEAVKVPLIVSWPGVIPGGQRCDRVVSALDVNATMLDALGAPPLLNSPGRSFLGLISEARATPAWDDVAFSEYCADEYVPYKIDNGKCYQRMIRYGAWKLIYYHGLEPQLFHLAEDPGELVDRAQDPACRAILTELLARLLTDWNPDAIAAKMATKRADNAVLRAWARQTNPPDQHRWDLQPAMNYLD